MITSAVGFLCFLVGVVALALVMCLWWRIENLEDKVYRLTWDLDALAGALSRGEGYEASERPDN